MMSEKQEKAWRLACKGKGKPIIGIKHGLVEKGVKAQEKKVTAQKPYKLMNVSEYLTKRAGKSKPGRNAFVMMN